MNIKSKIQQILNENEIIEIIEKIEWIFQFYDEKIYKEKYYKKLLK